jgi:hypothetical protein
MKTDKTSLIDSLAVAVKSASDEAASMRNLPSEILNFKPSQFQWSILECIEHLNLYGDFYLPELERRIASAKPCSKSIFKSGFIGNAFVNMVTVKGGMVRKMKTPGDKNPNGSELNILSIDRFLKQQDKLLALLESARRINLSTTRTNVSLMPYLQIRLGDTLRFVVSHNERHIRQAKALVKK